MSFGAALLRLVRHYQIFIDSSPAQISQINKQRESIAKLMNSRSSNRLNAANEILFGQSNPFSYRSDMEASPSLNQNPSNVVFKNRNSHNYNGYESYIDKQERLLKEINAPKKIVKINTNRLKAFRTNAINRNSLSEKLDN